MVATLHGRAVYRPSSNSAAPSWCAAFRRWRFRGCESVGSLGTKRGSPNLTEARQWCDLHTDQLSQAVLLRFAESGRLAEHADRARKLGRERLEAALSACERHLPAGTSFTRPQGGMNLWVRLPEPLDAVELLPRAQREGVSYLPGKYFAVGPHDVRDASAQLRWLAPAADRNRHCDARAVVVPKNWSAHAASRRFDAAPAMV